MRHFTSSDFWTMYGALPEEIRELADKNYALLKTNPRHPSLQLKRIEDLWSVRVGHHYRRWESTPRVASSGSGSEVMPNMTNTLANHKGLDSAKPDLQSLFKKPVARPHRGPHG